MFRFAEIRSNFNKCTPKYLDEFIRVFCRQQLEFESFRSDAIEANMLNKHANSCHAPLQFPTFTNDACKKFKTTRLTRVLYFYFNFKSVLVGLTLKL